MAIAVFFLEPGLPPLGQIIQLSLLSIYGVRLATYILLRERTAAFAREKKETIDRGQDVAAYKKPFIWIGVSILYVLMFSPAFANQLYPVDSPASIITKTIGLVIMALGLGMEALADFQKSRYKKENPQLFCNVGLFRFVRCPNYLGEILVWTGNVIAGSIALYSLGIGFFISAIIAYVCIVLIMMGSTKRLESKQDLRYGELESYKEFRTSVPVLFPFIPVYSLKNIKVFLE
jgi:steroid 5-alpha reductase family enzyme